MTTRSIEQTASSIVAKLTVASDGFTTVSVLRQVNVPGTATSPDSCIAVSDTGATNCTGTALEQYAAR